MKIATKLILFISKWEMFRKTKIRVLLVCKVSIHNSRIIIINLNLHYINKKIVFQVAEANLI